MRTYGEIDDVSFRRQGYCIYNLAIEYKIWDYAGNKTVYVSNMRELKDKIAEFKQEKRHATTTEI